MGTYTDAKHSNDYCIMHFNLNHHSKIALQQKIYKKFIHLACGPSIVYIPALGHVTLTMCTSCVQCQRF